MPSFYPKNKKIESLFDRLAKNRVAEIDSRTAREVSKFKEMRYLREKKLLRIGKDHRNNLSIIWIKTPLKKKGNGFFF